MTAKIITSCVPPPLLFEVNPGKLPFQRLGIHHYKHRYHHHHDHHHQSVLWESDRNDRLPSPEKCTHTPAPKILHTILEDSKNSWNPVKDPIIKNPALDWSSQLWSLLLDLHQARRLLINTEQRDILLQSGQAEVLAKRSCTPSWLVTLAHLWGVTYQYISPKHKILFSVKVEVAQNL